MGKKNSDRKTIRKLTKGGYFGGFLVLLLGTAVLLLAAAANGPDLTLQFSREIPSTLTPERLEYNISSVTRWPQWFYSLAKVRILSSKEKLAENAHPNSAKFTAESYDISEGTRLSLLMDPGKALSKRFEITARVKKYIPGKVLSLEIENDSTNRLSHIFKNLVWTLEFIPNGTGTLIRGHASAETCHWRSRIFGRIAERVVMNQVFYPNLIKLAELRQPFSADSPMDADRSSLWK